VKDFEAGLHKKSRHKQFPVSPIRSIPFFSNKQSRIVYLRGICKSNRHYHQFPREGRDGRVFRSYETGRVGSSDTRSTVTNGLVGDGKFSKVETDHFGLDLDLVCEVRTVSYQYSMQAIDKQGRNLLKTFPL